MTLEVADTIIAPPSEANEWKEFDEADTQQLLIDEHVSVIAPQDTIIDWNETDSKSPSFDSNPIQAASKNRFDDYAIESQESTSINRRTTGVMFAGIAATLAIAAGAIAYIQYQSPDAKLKRSEQAQVKPTTTAAKNTSSNKPDIEQVMTDPSKPSNVPQSTAIAATANPNSAMATGSPAVTNTPVNTTANAPVFVMSASEPMKPEVPKSLGAQSSVEAAVSARSIVASKPQPTTRAKEIITAIPPEQFAKSKPIAPKTDFRPVSGPNQLGASSSAPQTDTGSQQTMSATQSATPAATAQTQAQTQVQTPRGQLESTQVSECGQANRFGKMGCDEGVRVNFCKNKGNNHPDCRPNPYKLDP